MPSKRKLRVAAAQLPGLPLTDASDARTHIERVVVDAARRKVDLLVLPECAYPAYYLGDAATYRAADILDSGALVDWLRHLACEHAVNLVAGFVEERGDALYNTAVVVGADGKECGRHRKLFLWGDDNAYFSPGEKLEPIDTPVGRIGVLICADARAPEAAAGLVQQGAELIAVPTCWVNVATRPGEYRNAQAEFMIEARARECGVPFVAANKFGRETESLAYCGLSVIVDAKGKQLAQAPPDEAALIEAEVKLARPRPVEIPDWATRRLFGSHPPVPPDADALGMVKLAVVPGDAIRKLDDDEDGRDLMQRLAEDGVEIVSTCVSEEDPAERVEVYGRALGMTVVDFPYVERLMLERFGAFGCVAADHAHSFVPSRTMALDGAAIVFVLGDGCPLAVLRTRAAENRIFIAAAGTSTATLIDPSGAVLAESADPLVVEVDLRVAADKLVFAGTHIWDQRQPQVYAKAFGYPA